MILEGKDNPLWTERYRPQKISDCILPNSIKKDFQGFVENGNPPNLLLAGKPGTGKTTTAKALCQELGWSFITINGVTDGNIDTLRTDIMNYASSMSLTGARKCVILDEADGLTKAMQEGLKNFIETYSKNTSFILTCNEKNRIIVPIRDSRMATIDFNYPNVKTKEALQIMSKTFKRMTEVLSNEGIAYDEEVVLAIVNKFYPDLRRTLNELQRYSRNGRRIDTSSLDSVASTNILEIIDILKDKNFTKMCEWVGKNSDNDQALIIKSLFDECKTLLEPKQLAQLVLTSGLYASRAIDGVDPEVNLRAFFTEVMMDCF